jgi:hypothetical protein
MSAPARPAVLDLADSVMVSTSEAARNLFMSRARLAELVLSGRLELVGPQNLTHGRVRLSDVDRLAAELLPPGGVTAKTRASADLLARPHHAAIHLIADWGSANKVTLQYALHQAYPTTLETVAALVDRGLVEQIGRNLVLTDQGRRYVEVHPRLS